MLRGEGFPGSGTSPRPGLKHGFAIPTQKKSSWPGVRQASLLGGISKTFSLLAATWPPRFLNRRARREHAYLRSSKRPVERGTMSSACPACRRIATESPHHDGPPSPTGRLPRLGAAIQTRAPSLPEPRPGPQLSHPTAFARAAPHPILVPPQSRPPVATKLCPA